MDVTVMEDCTGGRGRSFCLRSILLALGGAATLQLGFHAFFHSFKRMHHLHQVDPNPCPRYMLLLKAPTY